jgi:hypothetical protein
VLAPLAGWLTPKRLRPIAAEAVAQGLLRAIREVRPGLRVIESGELLELSRSA